MKRIEKFFGIDSPTIGRRKFFFANVAAYLIAFLILEIDKNFIHSFSSLILFFYVILIIAIAFCLLWVTIFSIVRRLRDMGISEYWIILYFIPYFNILFFIFLTLKKGKTVSP